GPGRGRGARLRARRAPWGWSEPGSRAGPARSPPQGWKRGHFMGRKGTQRQRIAPTPRCTAGTTLRCQNPRDGRGRRPPGGCHGCGRVPASPPAEGTAPSRPAIARPFQQRRTPLETLPRVLRQIEALFWRASSSLREST
uniref:Uncharacterized protein n=1 Tax=Phasianus colchicus TaxID=9054 RepID=A0A669Q2X5_PHACC